MNKYEQLIEYVINEEDAKAEELFHEIVVEKSREIYESLMDDEEVQEGFEDVREDDDEEELPADDMDMAPEMGDEMGMDDEFAGAEEGEADLEDRVVDLEDQLDELMAEFDALMADEMDEPEHADMAADMDDMDDMGDMGDEEVEEATYAGRHPSTEKGWQKRLKKNRDAKAASSGDANVRDMYDREHYADQEDYKAWKKKQGTNEAVKLEKVSKGIAGTSEGESVGSGSEATNVNKKTPMAHNSGKKGSVAKPHQEVGEENGMTPEKPQDMGHTTEPRESRVKEPKKKGEDAGTNKKSITGS